MKVGGDVVLHLDVVVAAERREGAHPVGHAEKPLPQVKVVRTLVEQHAAALARPRRAPAARAVIGLRAEPVGDGPLDAPQRAEFTAADHRAKLRVKRVGALVEHLGENLAPGAPGREQPLAVRLVHGERLFDEDVQPGLQGRDAVRDVEKMGRGDEDGVDPPRLDHGPDRVERGYARINARAPGDSHRRPHRARRGEFSPPANDARAPRPCCRARRGRNE